MSIRAAIIGDYDSTNDNHRRTEDALQHSAKLEGVDATSRWYATDVLLGPALEEVGRADAILCSTGSPYRSFEGALAGIRLARERRVPFLGTCGGFQHAVLEYARNVLGLRDARHGEYGGGDEMMIAPLECSLAGRSFEVEIEASSRAAACYGRTRATEDYYCSYGINQKWQRELEARGLPIVGTADDGSPRILELPDHPFFVATLYVPQARSVAARPHPLVTGLVRAAVERRTE